MHKDARHSLTIHTKNERVTVECTCGVPQEYRIPCRHALQTKQVQLSAPEKEGGVPGYCSSETWRRTSITGTPIIPPDMDGLTMDPFVRPPPLKQRRKKPRKPWTRKTEATGEGSGGSKMRAVMELLGKEKQEQARRRHGEDRSGSSDATNMSGKGTSDGEYGERDEGEEEREGSRLRPDTSGSEDASPRTGMGRGGSYEGETGEDDGMDEGALASLRHHNTYGEEFDPALLELLKGRRHQPGGPTGRRYDARLHLSGKSRRGRHVKGTWRGPRASNDAQERGRAWRSAREQRGAS